MPMTKQMHGTGISAEALMAEWQSCHWCYVLPTHRNSMRGKKGHKHMQEDYFGAEGGRGALAKLLRPVTLGASI